uniref:NAD(P)-binding domain-containing protein n=1 Tax=Daphnia galeata TaxID=27404 RepID=A0A8J2RF76_9CRUS|nr:unnamed protein product [Daphnia galeata]
MSVLKTFVLGATGETGKELIDALVSNKAFSKVVIIGRRKKIEEYASVFEGFDVGYCCLGTTHKKSGTSGFVKVDRDYVLKSAQIAKQGGCKQFHLLTSQGSNKNSWFLYPRTKGEVEEGVAQLGFEKLVIYRPGLLLCDRQESRPLEKILQFTIGSLDWWRKVSIPTNTVAHAMINCSLQTASNQQPVKIVLENTDIFNLSKIHEK